MSCSSAQSAAVCLEILSDPSAEGLSPTRLLPTPTPHIQMSVLSQVVSCASDQPATDQRFQRLPPRVQLMCQSNSELTEALYSIDHWFILKGYNSGAAGRMRFTGQGACCLRYHQIPQVKIPSVSPRLPPHLCPGFEAQRKLSVSLLSSLSFPLLR